MEAGLQSEKRAICRIGLTHKLQEQVTMDNLLLSVPSKFQTSAETKQKIQ